MVNAIRFVKEETGLSAADMFANGIISDHGLTGAAVRCSPPGERRPLS
jgi:hypothetical protein